jgi:UDP-2,4-diacetamido-2,4,6-trideoxy-beta-L-altropyranose hydrolase
MLSEQGFEVYVCAQGIPDSQYRSDLLIVDHYQLDRQWESAMRKSVDTILVIDDLANRPHDCDYLLDQNLYADMERRYRGLLPEHCKVYLGPQYCLLRPEFDMAMGQVAVRENGVRNVQICFGGTDPTGETLKMIRAVKKSRYFDTLKLNVVVGGACRYLQDIERTCSGSENIRLHIQTKSMSTLMLASDLQLGSGGSISWERCITGLPAIAVAVADNQIAVLEALHHQGALEYLGLSGEVEEERVMIALDACINDPGKVSNMSLRAMEVVSGRSHAFERFVSDLMK